MKKILAFLFFPALLGWVQLSSGDSFMNLIGKKDSSQEVSDFVKTYHLEMANNTHYISRDGVELIFKDGSVSAIHLYRNSAVYGSYQGALPYQVQFGSSPADVKKILGKPSVSYNTSGYAEFKKEGRVISCWFESDVLNELAISSDAAE